ncbi:MAG: Unknown protein [uncultured Sulfurovum sp.]|uniref:Uncharacterized protein n=1 Tax=uncultured Sulfurovum sp. TaxID=269237 RepID=A0A6S6UD18_9BACT|nr:MAG: Unknown protein [uncultured Sulfurovum sp.]
MTIKRLDSASIILFLLPILTIFTVNIVGQLMFSDILVLILTPILLFNKSFNKKQPYLKPIMLFLLLWFFSAIVSDIVNETSLINFLRGISSILFFAMHIFVIFVLVNMKRDRLTTLILGVSISFILLLVFGGEVYSLDDGKNTPWKMGVGFGVTIIFVMLLSRWIKNKRLLAKILLFSSPIHLFLNARSLFLTVVLSSIITAFHLKIYSKGKKLFILLSTLFFILIVAPMAINYYGNLTQEGFFGKQAQEKYIMQTGGGKINILLAGRSETLISLTAISDSIIFGHGSWATSKEYFIMYLSMLEKMGKHINWNSELDKDKYLIPAHSMLLAAWVWYGITGSLFWFYILYLSLKVLSIGIAGRKPIQVRDMLIVVALIWDIFFSPFGQARRCIEAVYIIVVCMILMEEKKENNKKLYKKNLEGNL